MTDLIQRFPRRNNGTVEHVTWTVDIPAACSVGTDMKTQRLTREVADMAQHMPRWILTLATPTNNDFTACPRCKGMLVFDRGIRCVQCGKPAPKRQVNNARLAWFGLLPPIGVDGLERLKAGLQRKGAPEKHVFGQRADIGSFLLVPLLAIYPANFPVNSVRVSYMPGFWRLPNMPRNAAAHEYHMLGDSLMCLFAGGEWKQNTTCREVLQQRAYPHVIKMLNYANGKRNAFAIVS
jgi:hypothetical protein